MGKQIRITGIKELAEDFRRLGDAMADTLEAAVQAGALIPRNDARARAPYKTGDYRRKIGIETVEKTPTRCAVAIGVDDVRGPWLEFGTGLYAEGEGATKQPYDIFPRGPGFAGSAFLSPVEGGKMALYWNGAPHPVKHVRHPGICPRPHFRPAIDENAAAIEYEIRAALDAAIVEAIRS
ncbi:MAG: HK97 gp10 family phage protein [bacterium]